MLAIDNKIQETKAHPKKEERFINQVWYQLFSGERIQDKDYRGDHRDIEGVILVNGKIKNKEELVARI